MAHSKLKDVFVYEQREAYRLAHNEWVLSDWRDHPQSSWTDFYQRYLVMASPRVKPNLPDLTEASLRNWRRTHVQEKKGGNKLTAELTKFYKAMSELPLPPVPEQGLLA